ncbi:MAG: site-specific DNA-methyltransferase [Candidatus Nitrosopumilus sp. bin_6a]
MVEKIKKDSKNVLDENILKLKQIFPNVFAEGKIDFKKLKETLGDFVDSGNENYSFSWAGRSESLKNIQTISQGTLIPDKKESVNFDLTHNLFIEGDNLEVLKLFQKSYFEKVDMIYIDPPYNTGNDFIYKDNFKNSLNSYLEQTGQTENKIPLTTNPETSGRFHSDWISMIYPRIFLSRNLLTEKGILFVSIDDNEYSNLKLILDEIFGAENNICTLIWHKKAGGGSDSKNIVTEHEYILCYAKNIEHESFGGLDLTYDETLDYEGPDEQGRYYSTEGLLLRGPNSTKEARPNLCYSIKCPDGTELWPRDGDGAWRYSSKRFKEELKNNNIIFKETKNGWMVYYKIYLINEDGSERTKKGRTILNYRYNIGQTGEGTTNIKDVFGLRLFDNPKPISLIKHLIKLSNSSGIIMDFFAGSGTTANAVFELNFNDLQNRKFICVQMPEPTAKKSIAFKNNFKFISDISKERLRRVIKKIKDDMKQQKLDEKLNQDLGFKVFKLTKSNYKIWEDVQDEAKLKEQIKLFEDPLIEKYKDIDVLYEIIIKEGYSLNSKIEEFSSKPNKIYKVSDDEFFFYATLDKKIDEKSLKNLDLEQNTMFVCLDSALDDSQKINLDKQCMLKTI